MLQALGHAVDLGGNGGDLVLAAHVGARAQVAFAEAPDGGGHHAQRPQCPRDQPRGREQPDDGAEHHGHGDDAFEPLRRGGGAVALAHHRVLIQRQDVVRATA